MISTNCTISGEVIKSNACYPFHQSKSLLIIKSLASQAHLLDKQHRNPAASPHEFCSGLYHSIVVLWACLDSCAAPENCSICTVFNAKGPYIAENQATLKQYQGQL